MIILGWRLRVPPFKETPILLTYERGTTNNRKKKTPFFQPQDEVSYARNVSFIDDDLDEGEIGFGKNPWLIDNGKPWLKNMEKHGKYGNNQQPWKKHVEKKMFVEGLPVGIEEQLEWLTVEYGSISENLTFSLVALCQQVTQVDQKEGASISHVSCYSSST